VLTALFIQNLPYFMKPPLDTPQRLAPEPYLPFLLLTLATAAVATTAVILNRDKRTRLFCLTIICIGTAIWTVSRVTTPGELVFMVIPSLHVVGAGLAQGTTWRSRQKERKDWCALKRRWIRIRIFSENVLEMSVDTTRPAPSRSFWQRRQKM
jgi:hypothetical protein